jgi:hypothetical protein
MAILYNNISIYSRVDLTEYKREIIEILDLHKRSTILAGSHAFLHVSKFSSLPETGKISQGKLSLHCAVWLLPREGSKHGKAWVRRIEVVVFASTIQYKFNEGGQSFDKLLTLL